MKKKIIIISLISVIVIIGIIVGVLLLHKNKTPENQTNESVENETKIENIETKKSALEKQLETLGNQKEKVLHSLV